MGLRQEIASNSVQAVPAATLVGVHLAGLTLPEWAAVVGMSFIAFQWAYVAWKWYRDIKEPKP